MPTHPSNPNDKLREVIGRGGVVIVAGTGVSIAASWDASAKKPHPEASWSGLLENGLEWLRLHKLMPEERVAAHRVFLKGDTDIHHFVSAAQDVTRCMGGGESKHFEEWIARTIGTIKAHDRKTLDALETLRAKGNLLATTNYDGLLLDDAGTLKPITWKEPDAFLRAARDRETDKVIFLHGYWRQPSTVILDWNSYQEIARDERYREELATVWQMTTWLYVGCGVNGLNDPDFGLLLERYGKRARNAELWDFCLVRNDQRDQFQAHFDKLQVNICAVSFGDTYDKLPDYLRSLLPAAAATKPAVAAVVLPPVEPIIEFLRVTDSFFQYRAPAVGGVTPDGRGDFRFTAEEFRTGAVHRAQVVGLALQRLRREGCVWLEGPSAGGKTTVCLHLVAEWNHQGCEPLYLDLADEPDSEQAARELAAQARPGRMFILDNVHDNPKLACALLDQWKTQRRDSVVILLGWPAAVKPGHDYLSGHRPAIVPVAVQPEDWIGVYQSTFRQICGPGHVAPVPPAHFVKEWDNIFAADLVTFQYSLAAGLRSAVGNVFQIERAAADRYIKEKYLEPCSPEERTDLFRLAWFSDLQLAMDEDVASSAFKHSLSRGLVRAVFRGRFQNRIWFQPWHRSFARLLVGLAKASERRASLTQAAIRFPPFAGWLIQRLCERQESELGKLVMEDALNAHPSLVDWFGDNLSIAASVLRNVRELTPLRWDSSIESVTKANELTKLTAQAIATRLNDLPNFLRFTGQTKGLEPVQAALVQALAADAKLPADQSRLQAQAFATPLHFLVTFLQFTGQTKGLEPVQAALVQALAADAKLPAGQSRLQAQAFATPLHFLVTFLRFTGQTKGLEPVRAALVQALAADAKLPADQSRLQAQAFATPLHFLVTFLQFTGQSAELKPVQEALVKALAADAKLPADQSRLLHIAQNTNYGNLRGFVKGMRELPEALAIANMVESDAVCAKTLRGKFQSLASLRVETSTPTPSPIPQPPQPLPPVDDLKPLQLRSQLEERIKIGIERVLTEAWEAVPDATPAEERFKVARRCAQESIARLSPHIKRQVGAHFNESNWKEMEARDPKL